MSATHRFLRRGVVAGGILLLVAAQPARAQTVKEERLLVGESRVITLPFVGGQGQVSRPKVARFHVREGGREGVLTAVGPGTAMVTVFDAASTRRLELRVQVAPAHTADLIRQFTVLLSDVEGITVKAAGDKVFVDGEVLSLEHKQRVDAVVKQFPDAMVSLVRYSRTARLVMAEKIEKEMAHPGLTAQVTPTGAVLVRGEVSSPEEAARALKIARSFAGALAVDDAIDVRARRPPAVKTVEFVLLATEVHRDRLRNLGVRWSGEFGIADPETARQYGQGAAAAVVGTVIGTIRNFLPTIDALRTEGKARILHSTTLGVRSGEKGQILVGGEIAVPLPATAWAPASFQYKEYGVRLVVQPAVDAADAVETTVHVEVSNIAGFGPNGAPNFQKNAISTAAVFASDETMVLGGLTSMADRNAVRQIPGIGSIPILGLLFKSTNFQRNQTELVMTLTPIVRTSGAGVGRSLKDQVQKSFEDPTR